MSRHRNRLAAGLLAMIALVATVAFSAGTATAAVSHPTTVTPAAGSNTHVRPNDNWWQCAGYDCDNTDPYDTNCAATQQYVASGTGTWNGSQWQAQLWYSPSCGTVWAHLHLLTGPNSCGGCSMSVTRYNSTSRTSLWVGSSTGTLYDGAWTNQLYLPCSSLRAAASLDADSWGLVTKSNDWYSC